MRVHKKWIVAILVLIMLRGAIGPVLIAAQLISGAFEPGGDCGNARFPVPNTDLISWQVSGGVTATFERACAVHDRCYGVLGRSKGTCDWAFWQDMRRECQMTYATLDVPWLFGHMGQLGCELQAETYFVAVTEPLLILTYCNEQYYSRVGDRDHVPDLLTALETCGQGR